MAQVERGTKQYRRINVAFFSAGFVTFITLYDVQPLLPLFSREFQVPAALASLPLSVATCALAVTMLLAGTLSENLGRKKVMVPSLFLTSLLALVTPFTHTLTALLALRLVQGAVMAGLPAVAMAYLGEEIEPSSLGAAMGLYIGGNAMGGMTGRIFTASVTDLYSWRVAIGVIGVICFVLSFFFARSLPASSNFSKRPFRLGYLFSSLWMHLHDPGLLCLYGIAFLLTGSFVTMYNYITFRLLGHPYDLTQTMASWLFLVYLVGSYSSASIEKLVRRWGREKTLFVSMATMVLGALVTLTPATWSIVAGIAVFTAGFFGAHSIASGWVSLRTATAKAQASSLYLFSYYLGSSFSGTLGGFFWTSRGWVGVVGLICFLVLLTMGVTACLARLVRPEPGPGVHVPELTGAL